MTAVPAHDNMIKAAAVLNDFWVVSAPPNMKDREMRQKPKDRERWERWFAWHPVIIDNVTVWFEIVERRRHPDIFDWVYSYRTIDRSHRKQRHLALRRRRRLRPIHFWRA